MKNLLCFVTGAAIGSVVTWKLIEKKYKDLADEEIESVIETFKNRKPRITKDEVKETVEKVINKYKKPKEKVSFSYKNGYNRPEYKRSIFINSLYGGI